MELKVDISPEAINQQIADAIAKSAIGEELDKIIKDLVQRVSRSYDNPLKPAVERRVVQIVEDIILKEHKETIEAAVRQALTEEYISKITANILHKLAQNASY